MQTFKVGDVVKLVSGSGPMTISMVGEPTNESEPFVECTWTEGTEEFKKNFPVESLYDFNEAMKNKNY